MQRAESKKKNWNLRDCVRDNHIHMYSVHTHPISDAYHLREVWKKVKWNIKKGKLFCVSAHKSRYVYYRIHRFTVHKQYEERSSSFSASIVSLEICGDMYSQFTHKIARWWQWDGWEGDGGWVVEQQATSNNVCNINTWLLDNFTSYIFYVAVANSLSLSLTSFVWVLPLCYWLHTPTQQCTSIYPFERTFSPVCSRGNFSFSQTYRFHFRMITPFGCSINMNECRAHIHATNILSKQCNESTEIVSLKHTRRASLRKKEQRKKMCCLLYSRALCTVSCWKWFNVIG